MAAGGCDVSTVGRNRGNSADHRTSQGRVRRSADSWASRGRAVCRREALEDSSIRDFVPVLVERRARSALDAAIMAEASDHGHVDRRSSDASQNTNVTALPVTPRAATRSPATGAVLRIARPPASGS
ncbi:three-helix bundle dimerization domain-containing protein [Streptomyces sp. NPDC057403]|uniref:three-helix bundle dimerization domain-containing protein n=1 Tax=Streptomyces sp. NPDC057403 TaxID=3346119 RepID=UPI0036AF2135